MSKPFFYRIDAAEFIAEVIQIPPGKHKAWVTQLALDMVSGAGSSAYSKKLIDEVSEYRKKQALSGSKGGSATLKRPLSEIDPRVYCYCTAPLER
jgi:hypothetical protein